MEAVQRIRGDLGIGSRNITISTVGIAPRIIRLADDKEAPQINLAVSLHAATDQERITMMPVAKRYPLTDLIPSIKYYMEKTNRRVTFEWALISGKNDSQQTADRLAKLLSPMSPLTHVNVIPLVRKL